MSGVRPLRVLHAANMRQPAIGVIRQMGDERRAARELDIPWESRLFCPPGTEGEVVVNARRDGSWGAFKREYYAWLSDEVKGHDVVLLRYSMYDALQMRFVQRCPVPVVTMHHAVELRELTARAGAKNRLRAGIERAVGPLTLRAASGHAAITDAVARHQQARALGTSHPTFRYSNGAFYTEDCLIPAKLADGPPELLFISSEFAPWLGLDLLLEAAARSSEDFIVHIGGHLLDEQKRAVAADERFRDHGFVEPRKMRELLERSVVGLGHFGLHRKGLLDCDTLKVREYLRAGLPTYAGYRDVFDERFAYFRSGKPDFEAILQYAREMRHVDRAAVSEAARPLIDKVRVVEHMYRSLSARFDVAPA